MPGVPREARPSDRGDRAEPIDIRIKRYSAYPRNKKLSKLAAQQVKEAEEEKLNARVVRAKAAAAPKRETSRAFAAVSVQVFASENRDLASHNLLKQPTEKTKAAQVAAGEQLNIGGTDGTEPPTSGVTAGGHAFSREER